MDKEEVCIIQHADQNNNVKEQNSAAYFTQINGAIQNKQLNNAINNKNHGQAFIHPIESQNSVIQQTKDVKPFNQSLNLYELDAPANALGYLEQTNSSFDHSNLQAVQFLKSFQTNGQLPERSMLSPNCHNSTNESSNQLNATFYVVDSNGKVNLIDAQHQQSLFNNSIGSHKSNEQDIQLMNVLGSDLPSLKKFPDIHAFPTVNYPPENISLSSSNPASINDNYFTSYPTPGVSANNLSNSIIPKNTAAFSPNGSQSVQSTQLSPAALSQIQNPILLSKIRPGLLSSDVPVAYTRGRKKSKRGPFICSECRKEFSNQSTLTKHMITHSDERKFICLQCSKAFKRHDHLNGHMLTHREHKPYACDIEGCDKSYCDARSLRRHKEKHKENELQCSEGLSLSQKLPGLNLADKVASNIFMPINASVQLQYLAFQQQKTQNESTNHDQTNPLFPKLNSDKEHLSNSSSVNNLKSDKSSLNKSAQNDRSLTSFANENALLHQLLTNHDKNIFKPQPINSFASNHNSTVIKINDSYGTYDTSAAATNLKIFDKKHGQMNYISQPDIEPSSSKLENASLLEKTITHENLETNNLVECSICQKKFKSLSSLNGHMRLHGGYFKMNYLLNSDSDAGSDKDIDEDSQLSSSNASLTKADNLSMASLNCSLPYSQKNFDIVNKDNYIYDSDPNQTKENEFGELNLFDKDNEMVYHNINRQIAQSDASINEFKMPLNYVSHMEKLNLIESNNPYTHHIYANKDRDGDSLLIHNSQCTGTLGVNDRPKELNEVMFSPITPVTPLKSNSHFTFDFSANKHVENKIDSLSCKQSDQLHFQTAIDNDMVEDNYCFETNKTEDLLEKEDIDMPTIDIDTQSNFNELSNSQIKSFECENTIDKNTDSMNEPHRNELFANKPDTFNDFDLPSCKLTSDLYNRRLRKNTDDSNRTRELSIKQIAASLQSFSQSFERSHHNMSANQHLNHSYSVPTTPVVHDNRFANNAESYQAANLSHHSLPTTPIESASHFTFNISDSCHQTASPTTPVVQQQQQFNFALPTTNNLQSNEVLNSRHFDLSCLNESQYSSDYIYNSKDLDSEFIDNFKQPNLVEYETVDNGNHIPESSHVQNVNIFSQNEPSNYHRAQICAEEQYDDSRKNKDDSIMADYNETGTDRFVPVNSTRNLNQLNDKKQSNAVETSFNMSYSPENIQKSVCNVELEREKDINSNYITLCDNNNVALTLSLDNQNDDHGGDNSSKLISPMKTLLRKHVSPTSTLPIVTPFKKKKPRPEPLYIPPHVNTFVYHSRLRSPRFWNTLTADANNISPPPYTPPPMLSPVRSGPGLFWKITNSSQILSRYSNYSSTKLINTNKKLIYDYDFKDLKTPTTAYEPYEYVIPQPDVQPHVNIGHNYQARIPAFNSDRKEIRFKSDKDNIVWNPSVLGNVPNDRLDLYLKLCNSRCVAGSGDNKEYALHLLHICKGDILDASAKLVNPEQVIEEKHPLIDYYYADNDSWNQEEIVLFQKSLLKHDKDFYLISKEIGSKSVKQCVEFYYLWKKNCPEIVRRLRCIRRKRDHESLFGKISSETDANAKCDTTAGTNDNPNKNESCTNLDGKQSSTDSNFSEQNNAVVKSSCHGYPCRKCGKIFKRLKSRSAHMKIHTNDN